MSTSPTSPVHPLRTFTLTDAEWKALRMIVVNGWADGDYAGYGGENKVVQRRAMEKLDNAAPAAEVSRLSQENERLKKGLKDFVDTVENRGDWDEGCFYYNGKAATELQPNIREARTLLSTL